MASIAFIATMTFLFIRKPTHVISVNRSIEEEQDLDEIRTSYFFSEIRSFKQDVKDVLELLISRRMSALLPQICWTGVSIAITTGMMVPMITSTL